MTAEIRDYGKTFYASDKTMDAFWAISRKAVEMGLEPSSSLDLVEGRLTMTIKAPKEKPDGVPD